jgi:hypothetical protein
MAVGAISIIAVLAALDLEHDIGARSLCTTRLDFVQECKFDHDLTGKFSQYSAK